MSKLHILRLLTNRKTKVASFLLFIQQQPLRNHSQFWRLASTPLCLPLTLPVFTCVSQTCPTSCWRWWGWKEPWRWVRSTPAWRAPGAAWHSAPPWPSGQLLAPPPTRSSVRICCLFLSMECVTQQSFGLEMEKVQFNFKKTRQQSLPVSWTFS